MTGVIWHGEREEGLGVIEKLMKATTLKARIYYSDYSSSDYNMSTHDLTTLKSKISSALRL